MTDEQIKQNAEQYAEEHMVRTDGGGWEEEYDYEEQKAAYIAGAHSRDKEIEKLKEELIGLRSDKIQIAAGEIGKLQEDVAFYKARYNATKKELDKQLKGGEK